MLMYANVRFQNCFQFFGKKEAIFSLFKLQTKYLIFQFMYGLWSGAKIKQFKEIITYYGAFAKA